jgi:two-component system CheB/CheR fusion protein
MMNTSPDFPIVGVGTSAGLEAYRRFFHSLPADLGASFVLVQSASDAGLLTELAEDAPIPVREATELDELRPNSVYVIPPGKPLRLQGRRLVPGEAGSELDGPMAIDQLFTSLAAACGEKAIAVVLSGAGGGASGLREIKAAGGMIMAQEPGTAEFDAMPRSAIATGLVDLILPIEKMADALAGYIKHSIVEPASRVPLSEAEPDEFRAILGLLGAHADHDFRGYKKGTLERRIRRRVGLRQLSSLQEYLRYLRKTPDEMSLLFRDLLICVTSFYRDPEAWRALEAPIDRLIERKSSGDNLRAWVPACASGEEAYSLAMLLVDRVRRTRKRIDVQVFGTDVNEQAITQARNGTYPLSIAADIPPATLRSYFSQEGEVYRIDKSLRDMVVFAAQNVITDPPFSKLDLISCRNLMIYLEPEIQHRLIELFHFALAENGYLFLGSAESAERPPWLFEPVSKPHRIYRRNTTTRRTQGSFPVVPSRERALPTDAERAEGGQIGGADLARRLLLDRFVPPAVIVNRRFEVEYSHGQVKNYLDFPSGEATLELPAMAVEGLKSKLRVLLGRALSEQGPVEAIARKVLREGREVDVRIIAEQSALSTTTGPLIVVHFEDLAGPGDGDQANGETPAPEAALPEKGSLARQLEYELQATRADLQSSIEEMEAANEELKSSNEEVMSMNDQLQSTNEELESSREELQSLNEELTTVNSQLEENIQELETTNNDLINLLTSTEIATVFLDPELRIRRFTPATRDLLRIIDTDLHRSIEDLTPRVNDPKLFSDARQVLETLQPVEAEVHNGEGRHFIRRVRPYRTADNKIKGVVVTFTDITNLQRASERIAKREKQHEAIAELGRQALSEAPIEELLDSAVSAVARRLGVSFAKIMELRPDGQSLLLRAGVGWQEGLVGTAIIEAGITQAGYTLQRASPVIVTDFTTERRFTRPQLLADHDVACGASVIIGPVSNPWGALGAHDTKTGTCEFTLDDVNFMQSVANTLWLAISRRLAQEEVERERRELRGLADALPFPIAIVGADERYLFNNKGYSVWGRQSPEYEGQHIRSVLGEGYAVAKPFVDLALAGTTISFELDLPTPSGEIKTLLSTYASRRNGAGEPDGFYVAAMDITAQKTIERQLLERTAQYETIGQSIPFGVWICDAEGKLTFTSQSFLDLVGQTFEEAREFGWSDRLVDGTAEDTVAAWLKCVREGANWEQEHQIVGKDSLIYTILAVGRPVRDAAGQITSWVGLNLDITRRKREEERNRVISAELDHRVKNILATVSSMVRLTGRSARALQEYQADLEARIQAMARAHSTLADGAWGGLVLRELVENELRPYRSQTPGRISISGPSVILVPAAAQSLAMAIHELTTNAAKYGALSDESGTIAVSWDSDAAGQSLTIRWAEGGVHGVKPPASRGFGSMIISEVVRSQLGAEVTMDFQPDGLQCTLVVSDKWFRRN